MVPPGLNRLLGVQVSVIGLRDLEDCFWILNGLLNHILPATCMHEVLFSSIMSLSRGPCLAELGCIL
jgi:hypothetical protein